MRSASFQPNMSSAVSPVVHISNPLSSLDILPEENPDHKIPSLNRAKMRRLFEKQNMVNKKKNKKK